MRYLWQIATGLALLACAQTAPAFAVPDKDPDYQVSCTANAAEWTESVDASTHGNAPPSGVDVPPGTFTHILVCAVAGHRVRMNFAEAPPSQYHCGATEDGGISVWVDDVKVVDKRSYGGYADCMADDGKGKDVYRIIVNRLMHLTVCRTPGEFSSPDTAATAPECALTDLSARLGKAQKDVATAIVRTPPGLALTAGTDPVCHLLDTRLQGHMLDDTDPVEAGYGLYSDYPKSEAPEHETYSLDIDNDGVADRLDYVYEPLGDSLTGVFSWQRGGKGPVLEINGNNTGLFEWLGRFEGPVTFVRVKGKTYLYARDTALENAMPSNDVARYEAAASTVPAPMATRHLLKAGSNGGFTDICDWSPRPRPEEFL